MPESKKWIAMRRLLMQTVTAPAECYGCGYATPSCRRDPVLYDPPNADDPSKGSYDCVLTKKQGVWGERPVCSWVAWKNAAIQEAKEAGVDFGEESPER